MPQARKFQVAALASVLATPALAAAPSGAGLVDWLARNTDLSAAQVAIVAPEDVYSLQPLGPRLPTGEVIALVRTEVLAADWGAAHGFQSWEAHLMFDCGGGRARILKSTVYPKPNRQGAPTIEPATGDWFAPKPPEPAAQLLAAACDANFVWPLRAELAQSEPAKLGPAAAGNIEVEAQPAPTPPSLTPQEAAPASTDDARPPPAAAPGRYAIQILYTSSEAGAKTALAQARRILGPSAEPLTDATDESWRGHRRRYTARLTGFATASAAADACSKLTSAGQACVARADD